MYKGGKTGVYHRYKGVLAYPKFDHIFPLKQGYYIIAEKGKYGIMDTLGKVLSSAKYDRFRQDGRYFYIYSGKKMGLLQPETGELLQAKYDTIFRFEKRYFCSIENRMTGLIDTVGNMIEPANYHQIKHLYKDWYIVKLNKRWGMKKLGHSSMHYPIEYSYIGTFDRDDVYIQLTHNKYSRLEDFNKQVILDSIPGRLEYFFGDRYAYTWGQGYGLMSLEAKPLCKPVFASIREIHSDYYQVIYKKKRGVINKEGALIVPPRFNAVSVDSTKHIWIRSGRKWGVVSPEGDLLFKPIFDGKSSFQNHVAVVYNVKRDTLERQVYKRIKNKYERVTEQYYIDSLKYGLINQHAEYLAPLEYDYITVYPKAARLTTSWNNKVRQVAFDKEGRKSNRFQLMVDASIYDYNNRKENERIAADTTMVVGPDTTQYTFKWVRINGLWGLQREQDSLNFWQITPQYDYMSPVENLDIALVGKKVRWGSYMLYGFVDPVEGKQVTPIDYKHIYLEDYLTKNYARAIQSNNLFNLLDKSGKSIAGKLKSNRSYLPNYLPTFIGDLHNGWARVQFRGYVLESLELDPDVHEKRLREGDGLWGIMHFDGTFKLDPEYAYIGEPRDGVFCFRTYDKKDRKWKWGVMDTSLQAIIPAEYDLLEDNFASSPLFIGSYYKRKLSVLNINGKFENEIDLTKQDLIKDPKAVELGILKEEMLAFRQKGKWGFLNSKGEIAIEPQFLSIGNFSSGLARAKTGRLWGYINKKGTFVIEEDFKRADDFHGEIAATNSYRGWKFIDKDGNRAIKQSVMAIKHTSEGHPIVKSVKTKKWGIIDTAGKWGIEPIYDNISIHEGCYLVQKERQYGYFDRHLNKILPVEYELLGKMSEGKVHYKSQRKYGFLDKNGQEIIPPTFTAVYPFSAGRAAAREGTRWGFINEQGEWAIPPIYTRVRSFMAGVAAVSQRSNASYGGSFWGFIDTTGRVIVPFLYRSVRQNKHGILSCYTTDEKWIYFDRYGIPLSHNIYKNASPYERDLSEVEKNGLKYLINLDTRPITNPGYHEILSWEDSQILAVSKERKGLVDRKGNTVLSFDYEQIKYFDGLYQIINNGQIGYVDEKGKWIWPMTE